MAGEVIVITPSRGWQPLRLRVLWSFRELGYFIVWRELKVRYKQTILGASWAVLQPALMTVIFTIVFGRWIGLGTDGSPYAVFVFAAMVPWNFFSQGLQQGSRSLISGATLISRVYFPRLLLPLGSVLSYLLDLMIASCLLLVLMALYGYTPALTALAFPLFLLLLVVTTLGVSFVLGAANAQYRDVQYVTPFIVQLWFFATPIVYPTSIVPDSVEPFYALNPMVSVLGGVRWMFLEGPSPFGVEFAVSVASAVAMLLGGTFYFRRMERGFADVI